MKNGGTPITVIQSLNNSSEQNVFTDMRCLRSQIVGVFFIIITVLYGEPPERPDYPCEYTSREQVMAARILAQQDDLRELFCDFKVLKDRIQRKVVVLDMQSWAPNNAEVHSKEVVLVKRLRMREFFFLAGMKPWRGQPQVKLIKQNSILQKPLFGTHTNEDYEAFMKAWVEPGDIVLVTRIL